MMKYFLIEEDVNRKVKHLLFAKGWDTEAEAQAYIDADDPVKTRPLTISKMEPESAIDIWTQSDGAWFECRECKDDIPMIEESEDYGFICNDCLSKAE